MENSKLTTDDSSSSMYYSFNSTSCKTIGAMGSIDEDSSFVNSGEENITLEANGSKEIFEDAQTPKNIVSSPRKSIPKRLLQSYNALSSTPTKMQLLRTVQVTRGSAGIVCDLGLSFLDSSHDHIENACSNDKENIPHEPEKISSEIIVSVIEKTLKEKTDGRNIHFSDMSALKSPKLSNLRETTLFGRSVPKSVEDLFLSSGSRIVQKNKSSIILNDLDKLNKDCMKDIPEMISSIKICNQMTSRQMSLHKKADNSSSLVGKSVRLSIGKTTLSSPFRSIKKKATLSTQTSPSQNRRKTIHQETNNNFPLRRSVIPLKVNRTYFPKLSPKKGVRTGKKQEIVSLAETRKSIHPSFQNENPVKSSKSILPEFKTKVTNNNKASYINGEYLCKVCSRKFRVESLFEAHKKMHNTKSNFAQLLPDYENQCRYCDKKFAKTKALSNHLVQNCIKIPPHEKKKLLFPSLQPSHSAVKASVSSRYSTNLASCDSLTSTSTSSLQKVDCSMPPPNIPKFKKKIAHSGIYCTPNKQIRCHICKLSFFNILAYTEHSLTHSTTNSLIGKEDVSSSSLLQTQ